MSNVIVSVDGAEISDAPPNVQRITYEIKDFSDEKFFYNYSEKDGNDSGGDPTGRGERFISFQTLGTTTGSSIDGTSSGIGYVTDESWAVVGGSNSAFRTARASIMPKLVIPSLESTNGYTGFGFGGSSQESFVYKWHSLLVNDAEPENLEDFLGTNGKPGNTFLAVKAKVDNERNTKVNLTLDSSTGGDVIAGGAFLMMFHVKPITPGAVGETEEERWSIKLSFGECSITLDSSGLLVSIGAGAESERQITKANLSEGQKSEANSQEGYTTKKPIILVVYPVWNGLIVANGIQDSTAAILGASQYCPKLNGANILNSDYFNGSGPLNGGFSTDDPDEVLIEATAEVAVDMGEAIELTVTNCRAELAYQSCYFTDIGNFDEWFLTAKNTVDNNGTPVEQTFKTYPIYSKNGTSATLTPAAGSTPELGPEDDNETQWQRIPWSIVGEEKARFALEVMGTITQTTADVPNVKNGTGTFSSPANDNLITNVSCSIGLDGSSGSISWDTMPLGQPLNVDQNIGALTISASGGFNTVGGEIGTFISMGTGVNVSADSSAYTTNLVGLEIKLDDIPLTTTPFFDGREFGEVVKFLCEHAGIPYDDSKANKSLKLSSTSDIGSAVFDWQAGTTVRQALDEVMINTLHTYVVRDGQIIFYELDGNTSLPVSNEGSASIDGDETRDVISIENNPDFSNIRNHVILIGMQGIPEGGDSTNPKQIPLFPRIIIREQDTTPDFPWAKAIIQGVPGILTLEEMEDTIDRLAGATKSLELLGRTTIQGNASVRPYQTWGDRIIYNVSHNIDIQSRSWTTDLDFSLL